ncbi:GNAT family N-acetyltransferase (plasmid) [Rhizobium sp. TRM96647]|uniref:GNAT family N-acetyltransferase n=1 Tax=unclassified Rhizobium TaxID=2613769 RepID=UPI0021E7E06B|nr:MULTISPECIES: GNAT family N-acetyltransferase [unclassified Rhizobium]MCV3735669.1 GNAT family N-acetyltransferase [Rhizobium sp. TRM96647]MCV3757568.1 GNAT family N-acetyltransferase [Rhizobium sp. TRM96650]
MRQATTEQAALIRDAREDDMGAVMEIYNDAVANTTAIWNDEQVDLENRLDWFRTRRARGFPVLVAEIEGRVVGYASYGDWRAFDGYRHTAEHSIYVHRDVRGRGVGRTLLESLIARAKDAGIHVMIAGIEAENEASIRLHESLGFRVVGRFEEVGTKFGRWLDLTCMELCLRRQKNVA